MSSLNLAVSLVYFFFKKKNSNIPKFERFPITTKKTVK